MEQNIQLRNALTAHSVAIPANLQEEDDQDLDVDKYDSSAASDESGTAGVNRAKRYKACRDTDTDEEKHGKSKRVFHRRFTNRKKRKDVKDKNRSRKETGASRVAARSINKKKLPISEESSEESSYSAAEDEEDTGDTGSHSSRRSPSPKININRNRGGRLTVGGKCPRDHKLRQVIEERLAQKGTRRELDPNPSKSSRVVISDGKGGGVQSRTRSISRTAQNTRRLNQTETPSGERTVPSTNSLQNADNALTKKLWPTPAANEKRTSSTETEEECDFSRRNHRNKSLKEDSTTNQVGAMMPPKMAREPSQI
jgi:hypothetical protein